MHLALCVGRRSSSSVYHSSPASWYAGRAPDKLAYNHSTPDLQTVFSSSHLEYWLFEISIFFFGLIFGSFLNVCIYRLPRGLSVVSPRSACPGCGVMIAGYDNIPIFSW